MIGEVVSHYEILDKLGEGGMGVVYKALDTRLRRFVALKFLPPEVTATPEKIERFELEARAISALNHPHIATIHAMEEGHGRRFLVLEYLAGGTLRERLRTYRALGQMFPLHQAVKIAAETAAGLAHAHRKGIVHRDIKPENVMFTADGVLRITDFGLAKSIDSGLTRDGTTVGTAAYMAPEQAMHNQTSPRSDLFSLGVMLHEMIAGQRPFSGASELATMQAVVSQPPASLHEFRGDVPPNLERVLSRLLAKDPALRYQTGEEVAAELSGVDTEIPTAALNYSGVTQTLAALPQIPSSPQPARSKKRTVTLVAALLLVAATLIAVTAWNMLRSRPAAPVTEAQLAVLPFSAKSGKPEDIAFGDGLSDIVASRLGALGANLKILPESDLRRNRVTNPEEARRVFGIKMVLTGSVERQASGAARVDMHLIDTATGRAARSTSVTSSSTTLSDDVIRKAAAMMGVSLAAPDLRKMQGEESRTANAYDYYVQGIGYLQRYDQAGNVESAITAFQKAIQLEPSYALAYAGLSSAYARQYRLSPDQRYLEEARDAAMQALSRNQSLDAPYITLGAMAVAAGQVDEGIRQLRIALDRDPVSAEAWRELAGAYVAAGRLNEAETTYKRAIQYRPDFWLGYSDLAAFYNSHAHYEKAEEALKKAATLTPDNYSVFRDLGGVQMALGEWNEAEHSFRRAIDLRPRGSVYSNLGALYIFMGRYGDAVPALEQAVELSDDERLSYLIWGNLADAYRWTPSRRKDAPQAYRRAIELAESRLAASPRNISLLSRIAVFHAKIADTQPADERIRAALAAAPRDPAVLYRSALVLELEGKRKQSLKALDAALSAGYSLSVVDREPEFASLRSDPGYSVVAAHAKEHK